MMTETDQNGYTSIPESQKSLLGQPEIDPLAYAMLIIESYESEIRNAKDDSHFSVDLLGMGFCQGSIYKDARASIMRKLEAISRK